MSARDDIARLAAARLTAARLAAPVLTAARLTASRLAAARLTAAVLVAWLVAGCGGASTGRDVVTARVGDRDCSDFASRADAQTWLDAHPGDPDGLDEDGNGAACESLGGAAAKTAASAGDAPRRARVISVVDGDTIRVRSGSAAETVRLVGVDTPESRRPETPVECGAKRAASALRALLAGRTVTLRRDPTQDAIDRYGRTLAYVDLAGGGDAGERMVGAGWAMPYVYGHVAFQRVARYRAAESAARRAGRGVHRACGSDFHRPG